MKKIFTNLFLLATIFMASTNLSAQTYNGGTWYSLYDATEYKFGDTETSSDKTFSVFAPTTESLSFQWKKTGWFFGQPIYNLTISESSDGSNYTSKYKLNSGTGTKQDSYVSATTAVSKDISHLKFELDGSLTRYYKDIKLPLKKHILIADGGYGKEEESKSFGNVTIGNVSTVQTVKLRSFLTAGNITITSNNAAFRVGSSSNQGTHVFNVGANACASTNGASGTPASDGTLGDINLYDVNIYFVPTAAGEYSGTITISDGTSSATISVSGVGVKKTQTIAWAEALNGDSPTLPIGKKISSPANAQTEITYSVENDTIISIDGNTLTALKTGTTTITATAAETNEWLGATSTITVKVTEKKVQSILWSDNLTRFKVGDEPFTLTATASVLVDVENEIIEALPERDQYISYQSADPEVVSVDRNTLYINGEGETILTAILQGNEDYEEAIATMPVRVRVPSTTVCETFLLNAPDEVAFQAPGGGNYTPAAWTAPAGQLTFEARIGNGTAVGPLEVQQLVNGEWKKIDDFMPKTNWNVYGPYTLDRNTTQVRFYSNGSFRRFIKNVLVTQATYLETTAQPITVEKSIIGDEITRTIAIQYSNIPAGVIISNNAPEVVLSDYELGNDCGTHGEKQITVTIRPTEIGVIEDIITIHDEATGTKLEIPVTVHVQRNTQTITWEQDLNVLNTTDDIILNATATAQTEVYYTSSDSTIAYAEGNHLVINKYGQFTLTAVAVESEKFEQATLSKEITINTVQPTVSAWPTVEPIAYAQPLTTDMLIDGEAEVEGYFDWNTERNQTLVPGTHDLPVRFMPTNTNYYAPVDGTIVVTINKSAQSIVWNDSFENITVTDSIVLNASAQTTITYEVSDMELAYITENNVLYFLHGGTLFITAYAKEDDYYLAETLTRELTILPGKPIIVSHPTATAIMYGQTLSESVLEGGEASTAGSFEWMDSLALPNAGADWQYVRFVPEDQESFSTVEFQIELVVNQAPQTITWELEVPVIVPMGQSLPLNAVASSGLPITYILDNDLIASIEEGVFTALEIGQVNLTATQDGTYVDEFGDEYANFLPAESVSYLITIVESDINTDCQNIQTNTPKAIKRIINGQLVIIKGQNTYNAQGNRID